jgi:hypothetical protein
MNGSIARRIVGAALCAALASPGNAAEPVALNARVRPAVAFAPATVRIEVLVGADDDNRVLQIVADSGEYLRSSVIPLEGAKAPRFHSITYRGMPAGRYEVQVSLLAPNGTVRAIERHWIDLVS